MTVTDAPTRSLGYLSGGVGSSVWESWYADLLETVPDLRWPSSVRTFATMRHDPTLASLLAGYTLPVRRAAWHVDGDGCRPEVTALVADDLGLPIAGQDAQPSPARRRGVSWSQHLRVAAGMLTFGFMPFEETVAIRDGQARLATLAERLPQTLDVIDVNDDGTLKSATQLPRDARKAPPIPASQLLWYVHEREGANWQGRSLLRPCYGAWVLKNEMQRVHGVSNRRFGMGVPGFEPQPGVQATPAQLAAAQQAAAAAKVSETGGYASPPGFQFVLKGLTGTVPDTLAFIRYLDQQMARSALMSVLDLGDTSNGSRALGQTFLDLFLLSLQAIADDMASTATADLAVRLVDWNFGEDEPAPRIVCGDVGANEQVTAEAVAALLTSGALSADPGLELFLRQRYGIPAKDAGPAPTPTPTPTATARSRQAKAAASSVLRRQPTLVEAAAQTDFEAVQSDWQNALDTLVGGWAGITAAQRAELRTQIAEVVDAGDLSALATLSVGTADAADRLERAMADLAALAAEQAAGEASAQGVTVTPDPVDAERISGAAQAVAGLLGAGLAAAAARRALQALAPDADGAAVAADVDAYLGTRTDASLRDGLGGGLTIAQNAGRTAALSVDTRATYYASEILDTNTCEACADIDGAEYGSWDAAAEAYAAGGYVECLGGLRCRGIVVAVWDEAARQAA